MSSSNFDELTVRLLTGWENALGARLLLGAGGALLLILFLQFMRGKSGSLLGRMPCLLAGAALLTFALFPVQVIEFVIRTEYAVRIRFIMGGLSLLVLLITLESIRRTQLQERYALLWVATALTILLCVLFPHAVDLVRAATGMTYVNAMVAVAFTFLILVAFHFSVAFSSSEARHTKLAQRIALLEARLRDLERVRGPGIPGDRQPPS